MKLPNVGDKKTTHSIIKELIVKEMLSYDSSAVREPETIALTWR